MYISYLPTFFNLKNPFIPTALYNFFSYIVMYDVCSINKKMNVNKLLQKQTVIRPELWLLASRSYIEQIIHNNE